MTRDMLALSFAAGMLGIEGYVVRVEADSSAGSPVFTIIGLPDRALGKTQDRNRTRRAYSARHVATQHARAFVL